MVLVNVRGIPAVLEEVKKLPMVGVVDARWGGWGGVENRGPEADEDEDAGSAPDPIAPDVIAPDAVAPGGGGGRD
jgi:hypothetical protein